MNFQKIVIPVLGVASVVVAYMNFGWGGVALVGGALFMWVLLHFTRMMKVLSRASGRPIGYVDSAVMLNAKLQPGMTLFHVIAMTRSLGALQSPKDEQPEIFRWTDGTESHVTCEFADGKLQRWKLERPVVADDSDSAPPPAP